MAVLNFVLHYAHVVCAAYWVGSLIYSEIIIWPIFQRLGDLPRLQAEVRHVRVRRIMAIFIVGTILTGVARAVASGSLDRLHTPYGVWLVCGALVGVWMVTWWLCFPPRTMKWQWRTFYASFWVVLALMFGMRFAAGAA